MARKGGNPDITKYSWKPGQSGNPKGRPPGARNITTNLKELLELEIETVDPLTDEKIVMPVAAILNARLVRSALDGSEKAIREIYDRIEGRPKQKLDVTADAKIKGFLNACMQKAVNGPNGGAT